jgi:hypothetical protein
MLLSPASTGQQNHPWFAVRGLYNRFFKEQHAVLIRSPHFADFKTVSLQNNTQC